MYSNQASDNHLSKRLIDKLVRPWFEIIGYGEAVPTKGIPPRWSLHRKRMLQPFSTAELIQEFCSYFKDLDSPKDDLVIVMIDSDKDMDDEVHATENVETGDTSVPKSLFPRSSQVQELTNQVLDSASSKARDQSVPSLGQADTMPAEGEKNTNQATISRICSSQPEGEHIKKDKGKKAMFSKDAEEVSTKSDSDDETTRVPSSMVESSKKKELKKFDFVTESGEHVHLTKERISAQKKIEEEAKVEAARHEGEMRKEELIDLLGPEVVKKKGPITLKVYREDDTSEIILEFKASDLHLSEWREVVKACPNKKGKGWTSIYKQIQERIDYLRTTEAELGIDLDKPLSEQDPLDRLNDLVNKKRKHADDIHDFFRANKRLKQDFVTIKDFRDFSNTMLYTVQEIFFRLHQGPGLDDHAKTFSSLLFAKIDKRNLNPLKQMRVIEKLRQ
ncbi:hypothetical protein Tco_0079533 [Tanacetum coccineum]